jgi:hypothetical protein
VTPIETAFYILLGIPLGVGMVLVGRLLLYMGTYYKNRQ